MNQLSKISRDLFNDAFKELSLQRQFSKPFYNFLIEESINLDIIETPEAFIVKADIPGVKKEDINVTIENRQLLISVEAKQEKEEKNDEKIIISERFFGYVSRSITLPDEIAQANVQAHYENGVLSLTLPKAPKQVNNRIAIN
jgi:HSP20 family protein